MSWTDGIIRGMYTILTLWVYLVFISPNQEMLFGRGLSNAELGIVAVSVFATSIIAAELTVRTIRASVQGDEE